MKTDDIQDQQALDLVALVQHRAGFDPRCNLMVRVAAEALAGIPPLMVGAVAEHALAEVSRQEAGNAERERINRDMHDAEMRSPSEQARRMEALAGLRPYQSPSANRYVVAHRTGTLLAMGLPKLRKKDRPANATDGQLFAALGLMLLHGGLQSAHGEAREALLLDAAECIYAWTTLKSEETLRAPWRRDLYEMLPEIDGEPGRTLSAKAVARRFVDRFPCYAEEVSNLESFGVTLSVLRKRRRG